MPSRKFRYRKPRRSGAMLVLVALTMILLVVAAAFSIDVAFMQLTRAELRSSTDAAARAATEALSRLQDEAASRQAAKDVAALNPVAGQSLVLADEDIVFGHAKAQPSGEFNFTPGMVPFNSVRVTGRRTDGSPSGPVGLLFAGVFEPTTFTPSQTSRTVNLDRDICLVVDRSGSMNRSVDGDFDPPGAGAWCDGPHPTLSRWAALDEAVTVFLDTLNSTDQDEIVGLVSYSSDDPTCGIVPLTSRIESLLSSNYVLIQAAMQLLTDTRVVGFTNIAAGVDDGLAVLTDPGTSRPYAEKIMVVLTDGIENRPLDSERRVVQAATEAVAATDLVIHTITFSESANQATMQQVAQIGGGNHYHAPTAARLQEIFREIALTLPVVMVE